MDDAEHIQFLIENKGNRDQGRALYACVGALTKGQAASELAEC